MNKSPEDMFKEEKRKVPRFKFRFHIQYEKVLENGSFTLPVTAPARDISTVGISFYSTERMDLHSKIRVSFSLGKDEIVFVGRVIRMELSEETSFKFLIGVAIEDIADSSRVKINMFLNKINIYRVLDNIDLSDVVDIHLVVGYPAILKKIGKFEITKAEPFTENVLKGLLLNILDDDRYRKFMRDKEINFIFFYKEGVRFRVNLHIQRGNIEGTFRLIPTEIQFPHELGFPYVVEQLLDNKRGLILVAGRTGSGKTTTLASMVQCLNHKRQGIIICIEDPVEYVHSNKKCIIKQREVGRDTLSFSNAAKNALRQNPDVLVIGEILDIETMEVAITAAETGMLVLTSIHAADSSQALDRVISFFPPELHSHMLTRLSLSLRGVITQELIPRKDHKGLVVASEILIMNHALRRVIRSGDWKQIPTIIQTGRDIGMQLMAHSLEQYYANRIIDSEYLKDYKL
jgi:twitching motility protein PilT